MLKQIIKEHGGVVTKLLLPALEHHIFAITNISSGINIGAGDTITLNKNDIFDQDQETILIKYISIIEPEKYENYNFFFKRP